MPFVKRNAEGQVVALFREQEDQAKEYLPPSHPEVLAMVGGGAETPIEHRPEMQRFDQDMIRVFEDLTDILIGKRIVVVTDFPPAAQEKLMFRKRLRSSLSPISEILGVEDEDSFI